MTAGFIGVLSADLHLPGAVSLKDKRGPLRSLRASLVAATSCAVCEVDDHDVPRRCRVTLTVAAREADGAARMLDRAERTLDDGPFEVLAVDRHVLSAAELLDLRAGV